MHDRNLTDIAECGLLGLASVRSRMNDVPIQNMENVLYHEPLSFQPVQRHGHVRRDLRVWDSPRSPPQRLHLSRFWGTTATNSEVMEQL